ncbi:hypothetical protein BH23CYA1_BH23CYA1_19410 [soil metagenome]
MTFLRSHSHKTLLILNGIAPLLLAAPSLAQTASDRPTPFIDIDSHWAEQCIGGVGNEGLMKGYLDGSFRPDNTMTRAEFAAVIVKAFPNAPVIRAAPNFSDVSPDFWGKEAIKTAYERGFLTGYPGNLFKPAQTISRAQAIIIIANTQSRSTQEIAAADAAVLSRYFQDANNIPIYARPGIAKATRSGLVVAYPAADQLKPTSNITRGEATALLCRINEDGSDVRHYIESTYVAAFGDEFDTEGLPIGSVRLDPVAIKSFDSGPRSYFFAERLNVDNQLFFTDASGEVTDLWKTDGTAAGTQLVRSLASNSQSNPASTDGASFVGLGRERLWMLTQEDYRADGRRAGLWSSDIATGNTQEVADFSPALAEALSQAEQIQTGWYVTQALNERIPLFVKTQKDTQLWITDGKSKTGTQQIATFAATFRDERAVPSQAFATTDDYLFFVAASREDIIDPESAAIWRTDGTPEGTLPLQTIGAIEAGDPVLPWNNQVYFTATTPEAGRELWVSDGTEGGTQLLKDIYAGPESSSISIIGKTETAIFMLANSSEGQELWITEGSPESTRLVKRLGDPAQIEKDMIYPGDDKRLFFNASKTPDSTEMWVTDGTASGTRPIVSNSRYPYSAAVFKEQLFFSDGAASPVGNRNSNGEELWVSNGTALGTYQLVDLTPGQTTTRYPCDPIPGYPSVCHPPDYTPNSTRPSSLTVLGDFLYFMASGNRLFRTDGTVRGMELVKVIDSGDRQPSNLVALNGHILYATYGDRPQLWSIAAAKTPVRAGFNNHTSPSVFTMDYPQDW